jgi:cytoskeletal protein CcmA (bactofilin family)
MWRRREEPKQNQQQPNAVPTSPSVAQPATNAAQMVSQAAPVAPVSSAPAVPLREASVAQSPVVRAPERASSVISKGISVNGEIIGSEDLQVDGELRGTVKMTGARVTITPDGRTSASIEAREVVIRGNLSGNIRATDRVVIGQSGVWQGEAVAPRLMIEEGAIIHGKMEVAQAKEARRGANGATATAPSGAANEEAMAASGAGSTN